MKHQKIKYLLACISICGFMIWCFSIFNLKFIKNSRNAGIKYDLMTEPNMPSRLNFESITYIENVTNPLKDHLVSNNERVEKLKNIFVYLYSSYTRWDKLKLKDKTLEELYKDPAYMEIATKVLTDHGFNNSTFGEYQAEARVYSIELLNKSAEKGEFHLLEKTIFQSHKALENSGEVFKGQLRDYEDLLISYLNNSDQETLQSVEVVFKNIGIEYSKDQFLKYNDSLKRSIATSFFVGLGGRLKSAEIDQFLLKNFPDSLK